MRIHSSAVALAAAALVPAVDCAVGYRPQVGEPHPEFTLPDLRSGRPVSLSDYRGKRVLLLHFASW